MLGTEGILSDDEWDRAKSLTWLSPAATGRCPADAAKPSRDDGERRAVGVRVPHEEVGTALQKAEVVALRPIGGAIAAAV
jgi:hypothetical protein